MKRRIIAAILVLLAVGVAVWFFFIKADKDDNRLVLYGNVDIREVDLGFRVNGRIEEMRFEEGGAIQAGQVIAVLDKQPFEDKIRLAVAEVEAQKATLKKAEQNFERTEELLRKSVASEQSFDDALAARDEARANLQAAEARLAEAETRFADTEIIAPSDGVIITRVREPGAIVQAGEIVYTLSLKSPVWVRTYVTEPDLGLIYPGMPAQVVTDTDANKRYKGQIGFISPEAEFTPKSVETQELRTDLVYRLRVVVNDPDNGLRQGMPVTVVLDMDARQQGKTGND